MYMVRPIDSGSCVATERRRSAPHAQASAVPADRTSQRMLLHAFARERGARRQASA